MTNKEKETLKLEESFKDIIENDIVERQEQNKKTTIKDIKIVGKINYKDKINGQELTGNVFIVEKQIEEKSIELAKNKISEARRKQDVEYEEKERNKEEIINKKAKELIKKHKKYIGEEIAQKAINSIEEEDKKEEGTSENHKKMKIRRK